jgi:putative holliday junction resolvase
MINEKNKIKNYLAIDYGQSKVGLALADRETKIAFAHKTLDNDKDLFQKLAEIVEEKNVKKIIIGIPTYINREKVEYDGETLGKKIKEILPFVEINYQNEMFTTKMAQKNLIEKGVKGIKKYDDQEAARIILQSWLDKNYEKKL